VTPEPEGERRVVVAADVATLTTAAAVHLRRALADTLAMRDRCWIALAGGRTPRAVYERLAEPGGVGIGPGIDWRRVHVAFGDERVVPPGDADSNYAMARAALLERVPLPPAQVHRVRGELGDGPAAADVYAAELRDAFALAPGQWPVFDLILLGIGADGHTASLFPGTAALAETARLAVAVEAPAPPARRVSLTFPVLNAARAIVVLAAGADKAAAIARAFADAGTIDACPIRGVQPAGSLTWLLDGPAAAGIPAPGEGDGAAAAHGAAEA
jgi:6-phosphogluconolactonase